MNGSQIDQLVVGFLREMDKQKVASMTIYGFMGDDGKPVLRIKSNQPEGPTQGIMKILAGTDEASILVAAEALAATMGVAWAASSQKDRDQFKLIAHTALEAGRQRLLETVKVSGPKGTPEKPKIVTS